MYNMTELSGQPESLAGISDNPYFTLQLVAEGIWAAIAIPGSGALGNSAIIDIGDAAVVVDTHGLPQAAEILRSAAELLTNQPVKYIVNTHYHGDHHYGNQVFEDCLIISTGLTRKILEQNVPELDSWQAGLQAQIDFLTTGILVAGDPLLSAALADEIADKAALLAAAPQIRRVPATLTFTQEMVIHDSARSITLLTYGGGHTESDAMVYVADARVLIAGDLVLSKAHPAMQSGSPERWLEILQRIGREIDFTKLIPGHGEVAGRNSLSEMQSYLTDIQAYAQKAAMSGESADTWLARGVPAPYNSWKMSHVFEWNFRWLFNLLLAEEERGSEDD